MTNSTGRDYLQHLPIDSAEMQNLLTKHPTALPNLIIICSYAYYHLDTTLVEDTTFDSMVRIYGANRDYYKNHRYSYLITDDRINAGSFYDLAIQDYPTGLVRAAINLSSGDWKI